VIGFAGAPGESQTVLFEETFRREVSGAPVPITEALCLRDAMD
jgi:hypothetical protein